MFRTISSMETLRVVWLTCFGLAALGPARSLNDGQRLQVRRQTSGVHSTTVQASPFDVVYVGASDLHEGLLLGLQNGSNRGILYTSAGNEAACGVRWHDGAPTSFSSSGGLRFSGRAVAQGVEGTVRYLDQRGHPVAAPIVLHRIRNQRGALSGSRDLSGVFSTRVASSGRPSELVIVRDRGSNIAILGDGQARSPWPNAPSDVLILRDSIRFGDPKHPVLGRVAGDTILLAGGDALIRVGSLDSLFARPAAHGCL